MEANFLFDILLGIFSLFCLFGIVYFVFVRIDEKKTEKFEKRDW